MYTPICIIALCIALGTEKRTANEAQQLEKAVLQEQNITLENKLKGMKSRIQTVEKEVIKYKQQIQLLLNKATTDDELIEVLREEIQKLRLTPSNTNMKLTSNNNPSNHPLESNGNDQMELNRLKRLCKQQTDQLETQDELIRELRQTVTSQQES